MPLGEFKCKPLIPQLVVESLYISHVLIPEEESSPINSDLFGLRSSLRF